MIDIGFVLYKKGEKPGTLTAEWCHAVAGNGTGIATGGPAVGFVGHYNIRYFDNNGNVDADLELTIQKAGDNYELVWIDDGEITNRGIGKVIEGGLAVGWRGIDENLSNLPDSK